MDTTVIITSAITAIVTGFFGWLSGKKTEKRRVRKAVNAIQTKHPVTITSAVADIVKQEVCK